MLGGSVIVFGVCSRGLFSFFCAVFSDCVVDDVGDCFDVLPGSVGAVNAVSVSSAG